MRISDNGTFDVIKGNIYKVKQRMENLQTQAATLKKLNSPGDDPAASAKVLQMRTEKVNNDQFLFNNKMAENFLSSTDHALEELTEIIVRSKELALRQSSDASSTEETRLGVLEEVQHLYKQAVSIGNRVIGGRFLFGGYKVSEPPFDFEGKYHGDEGQIYLELGRGVFLPMNLSGKVVFNTEPDQLHGNEMARIEQHGDRQNVNLFSELQKLRISLLTGDIEETRSTLDSLDSLQKKMIAMRAKVGSRLQGLESNRQTIDRYNITNASLSSALEDADMIQVMSDLAKEETVYKSTLATTKNLIHPTLLDFLR